MDDNTKVAVQLVADLSEFSGNMQSAVDVMKTSARGMIDAMQPLSASVNAVYQSNSRLYTSLNLSMQKSREEAATSSSKIQQSLNSIAASSNITALAVQRIGIQSQQAMQAMSQSVNQAMTSIDASMKGIAQSNAQLLSSLNLNIQRTREELTGAIQALNSSGSANRQHAGSVGVNSVAIREFSVIVGELARGDMRRLESSLFVLARQFEGFRSLLGGMIGPMGAVAAAAAFIGISYFKAKADVAEFTNAMQLSGNMAGLTADKFQQLAQKISESSRVSESDAKKAMLEIARSGLLAQGSIKDLTEVAIQFGRKTGEGTDEALKSLLRMKDGAAKAAIDMKREGFDLISAEHIKQMRDFEEAGEKEKAQELLIGDLKKAFAGMADTTDKLVQSFQSLTSAISNAYGEFSRFLGGTQTAGEKIKDLQGEIAAQQFRMKFLPNDSAAAKEAYQHIIDWNQQILLLQSQQTNRQADADKKRNQGLKDRQIAEDDEWAKTYRRTDERLKLELDHLRKYAAEKKLTADQEAQLEDSIRRRFTPREAKKEKGGATQSQYDRDGLLQELNDREKTSIAEGKIYTRKNEDTAAYWAKERLLFQSGSSDRMRAEIAYKTALLAIGKDVQQGKLAAMRDEIASDNSSMQHKIDVANKIADMYYDPSKGPQAQVRQYYDAAKEVDKLQAQQVTKRLEEQKEIYQGFATAELEKINDERAAIATSLSEHRIGKDQYIALIKEQAEKELTIKRQLIDDEVELEKRRTGGGDNSRIIALNNQKLALERSSNRQMQADAKSAAKEFEKPWDDAFKHLGDSFGSHVEKMLKKQENFGQAIRYTLGDMVVYAEKEGIKWLANETKLAALKLYRHIVGEKAKTAVTATEESTQLGIKASAVTAGIGIKAPELAFHTGLEFEKTTATAVGEESRVAVQAAGTGEGLAIKAAAAISQIAMDAWTAMAGAYAAIAAIPYVGPVLAPVAAGAAFAGVIAIAHNIASAEQGWDIPRGVNPIVQLHEEEKVLPKGPSKTLDTIQTMLASGTGIGKRGGGDIHVHQNITTADVDSFRTSSTESARMAKRAIRMVRG